jgi:methionyl-tRNA formyltransferase
VSTPLSIVFAGTPVFAQRHLEALLESTHRIVGVLTQPDRPAGRGKKLLPSPVKTLALDAQLPLLQPQSLRPTEDQAAIAAWAPDVMVVVAYGLLLPPPVLNIPKYGCLNVHGSLLPRWRGAAPIQRAIEAGDDETGVTIMQMDQGLDTGDVLAGEAFPLDPTMSSDAVFKKMATTAPPLLIKTLDRLQEHRENAIKQDGALATYAAKISKEEAEICWGGDGIAIARQIRAFNPSPTSYSFLDGQRVKIYQARAIDRSFDGTEPGTIVSADREGILVACGRNALVIEVAQFPNAKPLPALELINGRKAALAPGRKFSPLVS